jgi:hypothetical protein
VLRNKIYSLLSTSFPSSPANSLFQRSNLDNNLKVRTLLGQKHRKNRLSSDLITNSRRSSFGLKRNSSLSTLVDYVFRRKS